jgi:DnaA family protein
MMKMQSGQIPLAMRREDLANWDNWLSRPDTVALEQLLMGQLPDHSAYIWGVKSIGKSHVLQACCDAQGEAARYVPMLDLIDFPPDQVLDGAELARLVAIDDIHLAESSPGWQEPLFALFNAVQESGGQLLVTASKSPQQLLDMLPDLRSRLSSLPVFQMPRFTEDQVAELLRLRGSAAGIEMADEVIRYCALRLPRDPRAVVDFINQLDQLSLAQRRGVTIPFVRKSGLLRV